jgi:hypothetical protein
MPLMDNSVQAWLTQPAGAAAGVISAIIAETKKASFCQFGKKSKLKNRQRRFLPLWQKLDWQT